MESVQSNLKTVQSNLESMQSYVETGSMALCANELTQSVLTNAL